RLRLKDAALKDAGGRQRLLELFAGHGIRAERLDLLGPSPYLEYLDAYNTVDVALDPFPFNGGTTTAEALWMGTPVVTLAGDRFASRMGVMYLSAIGLPELIASDRTGYVEIAVGLASDVDRLASLRAELRSRVQRSPLGDQP